MSKKNIAIILLVCLTGLAVIGALVFLGKKQVQPPPRVYKIGAVHSGGSYKNAFDGLKEGLKDFGWEEGKNISFVEVNTGGSTEEAQKAAQKFIQEKFDIIYSVSTPPTKAMAEGTADR